MSADGAAEADAERAVRAAAKIAEAAVSKAVQAAALAGLEYMPPSDMQLDTPRVTKVNSSVLHTRASLQHTCETRTACYFKVPVIWLMVVTPVLP